ncbi:unnamed protein product, partial [Allacma fusca]
TKSEDFLVSHIPTITQGPNPQERLPRFIEQTIKVIKGEKRLIVKEDDGYNKELKTAFHLLDKNQDGMVSVSEFQIMLKNFGIDVPDKVILALIKQASATGDSLLKETEFLEWISTFLSETPEDITEDLIAAFRVFDKDQNGYITKDELKEAMEMIGEPLTEQELISLIELADTDQDGRIDYGEFAKLLL